MVTGSRSISLTSATFFGAVFLVGFPTMALTMTVFDQLLTALDAGEVVGSASGVSGLFYFYLFLLSMMIGLQMALETAALQLHGVSALYRGSDRAILFRHVFLSLIALVVLSELVWLGLSGVWLTDSRWVSVGSGLLGVVGLVVLVRGLREFSVGYRNTS
jgi:hypothetical protein